MPSIRKITCLLSFLALCACMPLEEFKSDFGDLTDGTITHKTINADQSAYLLESPCPQVEIVDDLSSLSDFADPRVQTRENLISRVDMHSAESTCKLASKSVIVDLKLIFNGTLGAKAREKSSDKPFFSYPFFIAVTSPSGQIMAKEIFAASITYATDENLHTYYENLRQIIPINTKEQARMYKILIGFQVTPDQLAYNRSHMVPVANAQAAKAQ